MYCIYTAGFEPESFQSRYPNRAVYLADEATGYAGVYCYGDSLLTLTGTAADNIADIAVLGFNHPFDAEGEGLTAEQLDGMMDGLLAGVPTSVEVQLSRAQGKYLYATRFIPTVLDEPI